MALLAVGFVARVLRSPGRRRIAKEPCPAVIIPLYLRERGRGEGVSPKFTRLWRTLPVGDCPFLFY